MVIIEQEKELLPQITLPSGILTVNFPALTSSKGLSTVVKPCYVVGKHCEKLGHIYFILPVENEKKQRLFSRLKKFLDSRNW